jgi:hypothetical protein
MTHFHGWTAQVVCPRCGVFEIDTTTMDMTIERNLGLRQRAIMSSAIKEMGGGHKIDSKILKQLFEFKDKPPLDKLDLLLLYIYKKTESPFMAKEFVLDSPSARPAIEPPLPSHDGYDMMAVCWAIDLIELRAMFTHLHTEQYLVLLTPWQKIKFTPKGLERIATLQHDKGKGEQGFVAMWFDPSVQTAWDEGIRPGIEAAGYAPMRIDGKEHANKIDDEIIMEIRRSRFMVADFTGQRGGVYYEAGFAQGLGLPVIWTCREDDIDKLHFDIRQYNCLIWSPEDLNAFSVALRRRIEAILGHGPA